MSFESGSLIRSVNSLWKILSFKRRTQFRLLLVLMIFSSIFELLSLGSVLPFITALSDISSLMTNQYVASVGIQSEDVLLLLLTAVFIIATLMSASIRLLNLWANGKLAAAIGSDLSIKAFRSTLYQTYETHTFQNTSSLVTTVTTQVTRTVVALNALLQMTTAFVVSTGLILGIFFISWRIAIITISTFSIAYLVLALLSHKVLKTNSALISQNANQIVKLLRKALVLLEMLF